MIINEKYLSERVSPNVSKKVDLRYATPGIQVGDNVIFDLGFLSREGMPKIGDNFTMRKFRAECVGIIDSKSGKIVGKITKIDESINESVSAIKAFRSSFNPILKELSNKFNGKFNNRKYEVEFTTDKDFTDAVKYLRNSSYKNSKFIFASAEHDTGYDITPIDYNIHESLDITNDDKEDLDERLTFLEKLRDLAVGQSMNVFSGRKNYVVSRESSDYTINPGKGYDPLTDQYLKDNKMYKTSVDKSDVEKFIHYVNAKNGFRENINTR